MRTLYVFHFLGNSDIHFKKEGFLKELGFNFTENDIKSIKNNFREITKKILDNFNKYKDDYQSYFDFEILKNEEKVVKKLFPSHKIKFFIIYTDQKGDPKVPKELYNKDTIYVAEIIKKLNFIDVEDFIRLKEVSEPAIFETLKNLISNIEKNKKSKVDYIIFSSAGIPSIKPAVATLTLLNSIYRNSTILRCEIDEKNNFKILNWDIFRLLAKSFMKSSFLEFLNFAYTYFPLVRILRYLNFVDESLKENLEKLEVLVSYLYKRLIEKYFKNEEEFLKIKNKILKYNLNNEYDYYLKLGNNKNDYKFLLLSKIQDLYQLMKKEDDEIINEKNIKEAVLLSTIILDLLKDFLIEEYQIDKNVKIIGKKFFLKKGNELEEIKIENEEEKNKNKSRNKSFYSILPYLYNSEHKIRELIFGDDKIIKVEETEKGVIFTDLFVHLRSQRNSLAHRGYFNGNPKDLLNKFYKLCLEIFKELANHEFVDIFEFYKEKINEIIDKDYNLFIKID